MVSRRNILKVIVLAVVISFLDGQIDPGDTYSNCVQPDKPSCNSEDNSLSGFRRIDGTCNNLKRPTIGARNAPLQRLLPAHYTDGRDTPYGYPGAGNSDIPPAHKVSGGIFKMEQESKKTSSKNTVLFMTFGQFFDHDMGLSPHEDCSVSECNPSSSFRYPCFPILFDKDGRKCTGFGRTKPICLNNQQSKVRNQVNEATAFIDGSQIYGSDPVTNEKLRKFDGFGRLKTNDDNLLVIDTRRFPCGIDGGCSLAGDRRADENIALNSMHTVWARQHNLIATQLKLVNPHWKDNQLFQTARKIVGAILQHIVYTEWLPNVVRLGSYKGYIESVDASIANGFSTAAFRFGHSLIPNKFSQLNHNFDKDRRFKSVTLQEAFRNRRLISSRGIEPTMFGLIGNKSNIVDHAFAFGIGRRLFVSPGRNEHVDLTAMNIQRGRDHGIPNYGKWRQMCNLPEVRSFQDLDRYMLPGIAGAFKKLYKSIDDVDLFAAGISEKHAQGSKVGPTFECIFREQFTKLREGDRYFYQNRGVFSLVQLLAIQRMTMSRVLCDTIRGIVSVQPNAFLVEGAQNRRVSCERIQKLNLDVWKDVKILRQKN